MTAAATRWNGDKPFRISRTFAVPRERLWRAWTDREELAHWFGPKGCSVRVVSHDFRPGGIFHYVGKTPDGHEMWGKQVFREIVAPERLVTLVSFSDAAGGITRHPMSPTWPRETLAEARFIAEGATSRLDIAWTVWNGDAEEHRTFDAAHDGMRQGLGASLDQLTAHLAKG